jgi:hypothetical protein
MKLYILITVVSKEPVMFLKPDKYEELHPADAVEIDSFFDLQLEKMEFDKWYTREDMIKAGIDVIGIEESL